MNYIIPFYLAARETITNLVETVEIVASPVDRGELAARKARGMIIVRAEQVTARMRVVPGFWTNGIESEVETMASITVDGRGGRLFGQSVSGSGQSQGDVGGACEGGAAALADAASAAMRQTLLRMGEALANSERVRRGG